ncbi:ectoine/hydroxyectoine ABC transporter permease subunit EhuC [Cellulomonas bogoriensis]|nr:ectoine/hydroxyectoine ABC transporter permease subunit EhuC [Cellulomonas bogoriensis]
MDNLEALQNAWPRLLDGIVITLQLTLGGGALAFAVAVTFGLMALHGSVWVRGAARTLIEFFRGTSLLVQLFWLFYVLPLLGVTLEPAVTGILALGLNYGAYGAEVVRGSINAVPKGQWEVSTALSLRPVHRMRRIIWPQAWAIMIPSLTNLLIMLLKGTAVANVILLHDLTYVTEQLRRATGDTFFSYGVSMIIYFLIACVLVLGANAIEARAKHKLGRGPSLREVLRLRPAPVAAKGVA